MPILLVDGDPSNHSVISDILAQRGGRLLEVAGGPSFPSERKLAL